MRGRCRGWHRFMGSSSTPKGSHAARQCAGRQLYISAAERIRAGGPPSLSKRAALRNARLKDYSSVVQKWYPSSAVGAGLCV